MSTLLVIACVALLLLIVVQIARVRELATKLRGEEEVEARNTNVIGRSLLVFMVGFLVLTTATAYIWKNYMLGYGPHESASAHGKLIDSMFDWTLLTTYIVFIVTHVLLFWYAYKYRQQKGRKAQFISHNNTVEIVWTAIPALVMTFLVIGGLDAWNDIMGDVGMDDPDILEIEATGYQFAWELRYPGPDGKLGTKDFRLITGVNSLGQDFTDAKNHDDFMSNELVLPVNQKIRVRITAKDVLHDFYLPQFRVKMDAVPGIPTYFVFTPEKTTAEYRQELRKYSEYNVPDPEDPEKMRWETFEYELACAELCGTGHWSMKRRVSVVTQEEYDEWLTKQNSLYFSSIRGTDNDPLKDMDDYLPYEVANIEQEFNNKVEQALSSADETDDTFVLEYVSFNTGSATLSNRSKYQLTEAAKFMNNNPEMLIDLGGHTDATGDAEANLTLSLARAESVKAFMVNKGVDADRIGTNGYGADVPVDTNDTPEGRAKNRRTEFTILQTGTVQ